MTQVELAKTQKMRSARCNRRLRLFATLILMLLAMLLIWRWTTDSLTTLDVFKIEKGMTLDQTIEALGRRPDTVVTLSVEGDTTQIWEVEGGTILVRFDPQGIVRFRNISSERSYRPISAWRRFLRQLGL